MTRRVYRFGDCTLDIAARELRHADERIDVAPSVFDCIGYLLEHRERAVGRDELVSAVWGKTAVTDSLLGKTLVKARRAVGDTGEEQQVIRTIPRFGYHWVADVESVDEFPVTPPREIATPAPLQVTATLSADPIPNAQQARSRPRATRSRWQRLLIIGCILLGVLVIASFVARRSGPPKESQTAAHDNAVRYGVLPVIVQGSGDDAWLRLGLMDLIANHLRSAGLAVIPSSNVVHMLHDETPSAATIKALREATGARDLIVADARQSGSEWTVTITLEPMQGTAREVQARGNDSISAARLASDRLLALLGQPARNASEPANSLTERIQRIEAAVLVDDFEQARQWIASAPASMQATPELQLSLASIDYRLGRSNEAQMRLESLLKDAAIESAPVLRGRVLTILGGIALKQNDADGAEPHLLAAIPLLENTDQPVATGHAYMGLAICRAMQARYAEAATALARARIAFELGGDAHALARVDINEGAMQTMRDRQADALPLLERAAARFERLDAPSEWINALGNQVEAHLALLQAAPALAASERMVPLLGRIDNPMERRIYEVLRARALEAVGRSSEARVLLGDLVQAIDPNREPLVLAQVRALQARLDLGVDQPGTAFVLASQAVSALDGAEHARLKAETWRLAIVALLQREQHDAAHTEAARFAAWTTATGSGATLSLLAEAETLAASTQPDAAWPIYAEALHKAVEHGVPSDTASVATSYATRLIASGRIAEASDISGQVARWADRDFACALLQVRLYRALGRTEAWQPALARARVLAGERPIPRDLLQAPAQPALIGQANASSRVNADPHRSGSAPSAP